MKKAIYTHRLPVDGDLGSIPCVIQLSAMIWLYWKRICSRPLGVLSRIKYLARLWIGKWKMKVLTLSVYNIHNDFINIWLQDSKPFCPVCFFFCVQHKKKKKGFLCHLYMFTGHLTKYTVFSITLSIKKHGFIQLGNTNCSYVPTEATKCKKLNLSLQ